MTLVAHSWVHQSNQALCVIHGETFTPTGPAQLFPAADLYPSATLYPGG